MTTNSRRKNGPEEDIIVRAEVEHVQTLLAANAIDADCEDGRADAAQRRVDLMGIAF